MDLSCSRRKLAVVDEVANMTAEDERWPRARPPPPPAMLAPGGDSGSAAGLCSSAVGA